MITTIAADRTAAAARVRLRVALPVGLVAGIALGVSARLWMRLITDEPDFTWSGTIFIVAAFALFGLGQSLAWTARQSNWRRRWTTVARTVAAVLTLPIFTGAGAIMLPTVLMGSLAWWRRDWRPVVRGVAGALALPAAIAVVVGIGDELGWGLRALAGTVGFVAVYGVVVAALGATVAPAADGRRLAGWVRALGAVAALVVVALLAASVVGIAGD